MLDCVCLIHENNRILVDWFYKPFFSGRYLNFYSLHPVAHKKGIIGLVDRTIFLSHPCFHQDKLINIINILLNNGYPLSFIFANIRDRLKYHFYKSKKNSVHNIHIDNSENKKFFTVPYIGTISEKFAPVAKRQGLGWRTHAHLV
jgi:hypothetical protein